MKRSLLNDILIQEVQKRPILWNRSHKHYNNRLFTDRQWRDIARLLKLDVSVLKTRWKNIRDTFQRELKKIERLPSGELEPYCGTWRYFSSLMFLKDFLNTQLQENDVIRVVADELAKGDNIDEFINDGTRNNVKLEIWESNGDEIQELEEGDPIDTVDMPPRSKKARTSRKSKDPEFVTFSPIQQPNSSILNQSSSAEVDEIDEDLFFVKSLVPFFKRLTPVRKLIVRNEMHKILINEMNRLDDFD